MRKTLSVGGFPSRRSSEPRSPAARQLTLPDQKALSRASLPRSCITGDRSALHFLQRERAYAESVMALQEGTRGESLIRAPDWLPRIADISIQVSSKWAAPSAGPEL
jgi:hypothetical protein